MRKQTANNFIKGLITDLNPLATPADVMVEARNVDFITTEGDQLILQKRMGNDPELQEDGQTIVTLSEGFKPLAVKELNNIAYILSNKDNGDGTNTGEIGTFPSPDYGLFEFKPTGLELGAPVSINSSWDDGLADVARFTILTPTFYKDEYVVRFDSAPYIITVRNDGDFTDTFQLDYDTKYFNCATPIITLGPGETGDLVLDVIDDSTLYVEFIYAYVYSQTDTISPKKITWNHLTVYTEGTFYVSKTFRTIAKNTFTNVSSPTAVPTSMWSQIKLDIIGTPGHFPYTVTIHHGQTSEPAYFPFYLEGSFPDGSVTIEQTGATGLHDPKSLITVNESRVFVIRLLNIEDATSDGPYSQVWRPRVFAPDSGGMGQYGQLTFKGDEDFGIYTDPPGAYPGMWTAGDGHKKWYWGD